MTAAEMVRHRVCTAMCLLAVDGEATSCRCSCRGRWHGAMGSWSVPGTAGERVPLEPAQPGPDLLDELAEVTVDGLRRRGAGLATNPDPWHCQTCGHHWPPVDGEGNTCPVCGGRGGFHPADRREEVVSMS